MSECCGGPLPYRDEIPVDVRDIKALKFVATLNNELSEGTLQSIKVVAEPNQEVLNIIKELFADRVPFTLTYDDFNTVDICFDRGYGREE